MLSFQFGGTTELSNLWDNTVLLFPHLYYALITSSTCKETVVRMGIRMWKAFRTVRAMQLLTMFTLVLLKCSNGQANLVTGN